MAVLHRARRRLQLFAQRVRGLLPQRYGEHPGHAAAIVTDGADPAEDSLGAGLQAGQPAGRDQRRELVGRRGHVERVLDLVVGAQRCREVHQLVRRRCERHLQEVGRRRREIRALGVGLDLQRQARLGVGPHVDVVDRRLLLGGLQPQPGCVDAAGDPLRRQPADLVGTGVAQRQQPELWAAAGRRHAAAGPVAPAPVRRHPLVLVLPLGDQRAVVEQVGLTGGVDAVDPPDAVVLPPDPQPGALTQQVGDLAELVGHRQLEGAGGLREARVGHRVRLLHQREQLGGRQLGVVGGKGTDHERRADQEQHAQGDEARTAGGSHQPSLRRAVRVRRMPVGA